LGYVREGLVQYHGDDQHDDPDDRQDCHDPTEDDTADVAAPNEDDCKQYEEHPLEDTHDQPPNRLCLVVTTGSSST